jgi:hypothetical protein
MVHARFSPVDFYFWCDELFLIPLRHELAMLLLCPNSRKYACWRGVEIASRAVFWCRVVLL